VHRLGIGWLEDLEKNAEALNIAASCALLSTPTLICHGSKDAAVPLEEGEMLQRAFEPGVARLLCIENAGHTFGARHPLTEVPPDLETVLTETVDMFAGRLL
jgi:pimeloyl-ACP methyl ester carboxylesterase